MLSFVRVFKNKNGGGRMKISEFKKAIDSIGFYNDKDFKVVEDDFDFYIESDTKILAAINKSERCFIDTKYLDFLELEERLRQDLLDVIYKFASTPIPEREDSKIYNIPLPHLKTSNGEQLFLTHQGNFFPHVRNTELRQTWKEKDLIHIPEEYRDFAVEIIEVEE